MNQGDGFSADFLSPQFQAGNIDSQGTEEGSYLADHTGNIFVVQQQNRSLGNGFQMKMVDPHQTHGLIAEDRSRGRVGTIPGLYPDIDRI